jgi:hypothetical protein
MTIHGYILVKKKQKQNKIKNSQYFWISLVFEFAITFDEIKIENSNLYPSVHLDSLYREITNNII